MWMILRKRRGRHSRWRVLYRGSESEARRRYLKEHCRLCNGHIVLVAGLRIVAHQWAPRLHLHR
jgi:hypothetical protein